jgi:hypothetical protein
MFNHKVYNKKDYQASTFDSPFSMSVNKVKKNNIDTKYFRTFVTHYNC